MARIRTIKPGFFRHGGLFDAEQETGLPLRVAYAGLWTACDRSGRFVWDPRELKLDCLPHDNVDFSRVLDALATRGFIVKYAVNGKVYGHVPSWSDHQVVNNREADSLLPEPTPQAVEVAKEVYASPTRGARVTETLVQHQGEGKGREQEGKGREGKECVVAVAPTRPQSEPEAMVDSYNTVAERIDIPACTKLTDPRRRGLLKIPIAEWNEALRKLEASSFCRGANGKWRASIDFLLQPSSRQKLLEGTYDDHGNASPSKFEAMLAGVLAAAGGGDAGETVEPLPAGSQITGSLENTDGRLLGPPEPVSSHRH